VIRQSGRAIKDLTDGVESLAIGEMTAPTCDVAPQKPWAAAVGLHLRIVVSFECNAIEAVETVEQVTRHPSQIGGIADAITKAVDDETVHPRVS